MKTGDHAPLTGVALRNTKPWKTSRAEVARAQAAWRECATLRKLAGFRNRALDGDQTIAPAIKARNGTKQAMRIRMTGRGEKRFGPGLLDNTSRIHDGNPFAYLRNSAEIVADKHQSHAGFRAQGSQQIEYLSLDRRIEGSRRLISDKDVGVARERHGDHQALVLAT